MVLSQPPNLNNIIKKGCVEGVKNGIIFFFFAFLLTRPLAWARILGMSLSSIWSLYLAIFSKFLPWTNYFNVLSNVLYLTASYKKEIPLPSLDDYIK